ncbi:unnamed protein product, partial [Aphanomyces euteiches]
MELRSVSTRYCISLSLPRKTALFGDRSWKRHSFNDSFIFALKAKGDGQMFK